MFHEFPFAVALQILMYTPLPSCVGIRGGRSTALFMLENTEHESSMSATLRHHLHMSRSSFASPDRGPRCYTVLCRSSRSVTSGQAEAALHTPSAACLNSIWVRINNSETAHQHPPPPFCFYQQHDASVEGS